MPTQHFKMPLLLPFKFVPVSSTPGIHFDDRWAYEHIRNFQLPARYHQKWKRSETTKLQIESSVMPDNLKLLDINGAIVKQFVWNVVVNEISYKVYETTFDISDVPEDIYFLYSHASLLDVISWPAITEPINSKNDWPNTIGIVYKNSYNDNDVAWTTGIEMLFRLEAGIMNIDPKRDNTTHINQENRPRLLKGRPFREFDFLVADAPGVAEWVVDLLNNIMCCDYTVYEGKRYLAKPGSELEITRRLSYPLVGAKQTLLEWDNKKSLEFNNTAEIAPGLVTAYNIQTGFFGPGSTVPITEVIENG